MAENIHLWINGTAAVIDTVLLFALMERHNWRAAPFWMLVLALGVWCWHAGTLVRQMADHSIGAIADPIRWAAMTVMAGGLLLIPSAVLHGSCRLLRHGRFQVGPRPDPRLFACYLPLGLLYPICAELKVRPGAPFLETVAAFQLPYAIWLACTALIAGYALTCTSQRSENRMLKLFSRSLAGSILVIALATLVFVLIWARDRQTAALLEPVINLAPIAPILLFAYFVMRFQLFPLILERTLVYGVILMGAILFQAVVVRDAVSAMGDKYRMDLAVVEALFVLLVVLAYEPLRDRVAAALRSLVDSSSQRRMDCRKLAVHLATRATDPAPELMHWFTATLRQTLGAEVIAGWLSDHAGKIIYRAGISDCLDDATVAMVQESMALENHQFITRYSTTTSQLLSLMDHHRIGALFRFQRAEIQGLFLTGCSKWGQPPSDEDLTALSLLVEQFGITLQNSELIRLQAAADLQILQQQKMSALGLLAGSLAHEIKNPLSTIKTITHVLAEDLGSSSIHAADLKMIHGEIDRLAAATNELLESARPIRANQGSARLTAILAPTLRLLHHLARESRVELKEGLPQSSIILPESQIGLREIVFNLVSNAVEAAGSGGTARFDCRIEQRVLILTVQDSGPGVPEHQLPLIFEPFFTTKSSGTGLGLSTVARRVREMGGTIQCVSRCSPTIFEVRLPLPEASCITHI